MAAQAAHFDAWMGDRRTTSELQGRRGQPVRFDADNEHEDRGDSGQDDGHEWKDWSMDDPDPEPESYDDLDEDDGP